VFHNSADVLESVYFYIKTTVSKLYIYSCILLSNNLFSRTLPFKCDYSRYRGGSFLTVFINYIITTVLWKFSSPQANILVSHAGGSMSELCNHYTPEEVDSNTQGTEN
jgi:hypothetical protein